MTAAVEKPVVYTIVIYQAATVGTLAKELGLRPHEVIGAVNIPQVSTVHDVVPLRVAEKLCNARGFAVQWSPRALTRYPEFLVEPTYRNAVFAGLAQVIHHWDEDKVRVQVYLHDNREAEDRPKSLSSPDPHTTRLMEMATRAAAAIATA